MLSVIFYLLLGKDELLDGLLYFILTFTIPGVSLGSLEEYINLPGHISLHLLTIWS